MTRPGAAILAAGEGRRFGGRKLLALLDGRPLLQHVIDAANAAALDPVVVVLGFAADEILAAIELGRARAVRNEQHALGQSTSLRRGVRTLTEAGADAALLLLGDMPGITPALLDAIVARQRATAAAAVVCSWRGRRSPPALLHRDIWPELDKLTGDVGARELLAGRADVVVLEVHDPLGVLDDVDTIDDHTRLAGGRDQSAKP